MLGNLVASLIAAEKIVTTGARPKAMRPVAEKLITKARKGGVHNQRQVVAFIRDKGHGAQAVRGDRPALCRPPRRLRQDPQARATSGRQRPDGARRARVRLFEPGNEAAPSGPLRRVMLLVAYDGARFHGFAAQPGQDTVGGALADTLSSMTGHQVSLTCAGRTDAGVHALGQVVHADLDGTVLEKWAGCKPEPGTVLERLATSLSHQLGPTITVIEARVALEGFHARHSATSRRYR